MESWTDKAEFASQGFDPVQYLRIFKRRKMLFVVPFLLCLVVALIAINVLTPIYFSSGQIRVIHDATTASSLPREVSRYNVRNQDREALINIETIVTGPKFLERVAQEISLLHSSAALTDSQAQASASDLDVSDPLRLRGLAWRLRQQIRVEQDGPHLFSIGVRDPDPEHAYQVAQVVLNRFLEEERASRLQPSTSTLTFLENQRRLRQDDLTAAESALTQYQRSMVSASLAGNPINENNINQAENALSRLQAQYFESDAAELFALERRARTVVQDLPPIERYLQDGAVTLVARELTDLEYDQVIDQLSFSRGGDAQNLLGGTRLRLNSAVERRSAREFPQLGVMDRNKVSQYFYRGVYRDVHRRVMNRLEETIQEFRDFMTRQPQQSATLSRLRQEAERARETLETIQHDIDQENLRIEASLSEIGYKMVVRQDPRLPGAPIEPNKMKLGFMSLMLALALGIGLVILAEVLDRSLRTVSQIETALQVPVLGTLPAVQSEYFRRQKARRLGIWTLLIVVILAVAAVGMLVLYPRLG